MYRQPAAKPRNRLPLLDRVAIKTPCKASWNDMEGVLVVEVKREPPRGGGDRDLVRSFVDLSFPTPEGGPVNVTLPLDLSP
jgi:hypothetical protein